MNVLARLKKRAGQLKAEDLKYVYNLVAPPMLGAMSYFANAASVEEMRAYANSIPYPTNLGELSDAELLKLRDQLQAIWDFPGPASYGRSSEDEKKFSRKIDPILDEWLTRYPLTDQKRWNVWLKEGYFFPTEMNFQALMARILYDNRNNLKKCAKCDRRFIARKYSSKYCAQPDCRRFYNNERQIESKLRKEAKKSTAKTKARRTA